MIDFDISTQEAIMTPDLAMKFLVWAVYFHGIEIETGKSFARYAPRFSPADAARLDRLQVALFNCFDPASVGRSSEQLKLARLRGEQSPWSATELDALFGSEQKAN